MAYLSKFQDDKETVLILCKTNNRDVAVDMSLSTLDEEGKAHMQIQLAKKLTLSQEEVLTELANELCLLICK